MSSGESLNPLEDTRAEIGRILLWDTIKETFQEHALVAGLQDLHTGYWSPRPAETRFVLVSIADASRVEDIGPDVDAECDIQISGIWLPGVGINSAAVAYKDAHTGRELWTYHIAAGGIRQCPSQGMEPTPMDEEDIRDIRSDIKESEWSQVASEIAAKNLMFLTS